MNQNDLQPEKGNFVAANHDNEEGSSDSPEENTLSSLEDTGESPSLQEQETPITQNNGVGNLSSSTKSSVPKPARGTKESVEIEMKKYAHEMSDYLRWKENLCLSSIDLQIGGPYFELWKKEANLFFRRLVILKKRSERVKSKQRA